ncbi:MAG: hypothetical protein H6736_22680 [Alphaproteobacteria bacterium]|nr:hypothetical protein [Alphaproteobacteria bacterium]
MLALLFACGDPPAPPPEPVVVPEPEPEPEPVTWETQVEPPVRPALDAARDGAVFVRIERGVRGRVLQLDGDGLRVVSEAARDLHRALDGSVWVLEDTGVRRLDGEETLTLEVPDGADRMALDARGRVWVVDREALARWDGSTWAQAPLEGLGDRPIVKDLAVDADGRAWISALDGVFRFEGSTFTPMPLPGTPIPGELRVDDGVHVSSSGGWFTAGPDGWLTHGDERSLQEGFDSHAGVRVLAPFQGTVDVIRDGAEVRSPRPAGASSSGAASVDTRGRAWVASDVGLHAVVGKEVTTWLSASDPVLDGTIAQVVATAAGPAVLPTPGPARTSEVTVRFTRAGAPLANAAVELCPQPQMLFSGESPCDGSAYRAKAKTSADGVAVFAAVPRAALRPTYVVDGGWKGVLGTAMKCCAGVEVEKVDLGEVQLP